MMDFKISQLMCRLVLNNHQRYLLIYGIRCAIGDFNHKLETCDKRDAMYIRACKEQIDALYDLEEVLLKCKAYYEEA